MQSCYVYWNMHVWSAACMFKAQKQVALMEDDISHSKPIIELFFTDLWLQLMVDFFILTFKTFSVCVFPTMPTYLKMRREQAVVALLAVCLFVVDLIYALWKE